jgi:signal transduction histidine kinase/CheY-like chemotaxis protein
VRSGRAGRRTAGVPFAAYFVLLVLIFVSAIAATVVYVQVQTARDARRQARSDAAFASSAASKHLGEQIATVRATVAGLAANPSIVQALTHPRDCTLTFADGGAGHVDVLRPDGVAMCSSRARAKDGSLTGYVGEAWVRPAASGPLFRGPLTDRTTGAPVVVVSAPAPGGKVVVAAFVALRSLGTGLASVYGGNTHPEFLVVSRRSSQVVARSLQPRRWIGTSLRGTTFDAGLGASDQKDLDGTRRIYVSSPVAGTRWEVFVGEDEARALAAGKRLRNRELEILLAALALLLAATIFVYRRVVAPIKKLSDGVKSTAENGQFTPVAVHGPAEVIALGNQINALTASVNAQEAVRFAREQAQRANEAKSRFLSHMSHEMRTPLAAIMGFADLLATRGDLGERQRVWTGNIRQGGEHLLALVNELLEIARIEAGKMTLAIEPVDVESAVDEVLQLAAPLAAERGVRFAPVIAASTQRALADPLRIRQVLLNLVSNAIKYNREGGEVRIRIDDGVDGTVRIAVADTGLGMTSETLAQLFRPFERLGAEQGPVPGSGLGLTVTKGLVEAMQGRLDVHSEVGSGTTFSLSLPIEDRAAAQPLSSSRPAVEGDVLYIEDNRTNLQIVDSILTDLRPGIDLRTATTGASGADLAEQRRPDLLLLDLNLPDMKGEEVLRRLRARIETADVPILVLSADSTSRNITRLLHTGADAYLTKPLEIPQFLETIDRLLSTA